MLSVNLRQSGILDLLAGNCHALWLGDSRSDYTPGDGSNSSNVLGALRHFPVPAIKGVSLPHHQQPTAALDKGFRGSGGGAIEAFREPQSGASKSGATRFSGGIYSDISTLIADTTSGNLSILVPGDSGLYGSPTAQGLFAGATADSSWMFTPRNGGSELYESKADVELWMTLFNTAGQPAKPSVTAQTGWAVDGNGNAFTATLNTAFSQAAGEAYDAAALPFTTTGLDRDAPGYYAVRNYAFPGTEEFLITDHWVLNPTVTGFMVTNWGVGGRQIEDFVPADDTEVSAAPTNRRGWATGARFDAWLAAFKTLDPVNARGTWPNLIVLDIGANDTDAGQPDWISKAERDLLFHYQAVLNATGAAPKILVVPPYATAGGPFQVSLARAEAVFNAAVEWRASGIAAQTDYPTPIPGSAIAAVNTAQIAVALGDTAGELAGGVFQGGGAWLPDDVHLSNPGVDVLWQAISAEIANPTEGGGGGARSRGRSRARASSSSEYV